MKLENTIAAFQKLGIFLQQFRSDVEEDVVASEVNGLFYEKTEMAIQRAHQMNGWFTPSHIRSAMYTWSECLRPENLEKWLMPYRENIEQKDTSKTIAIIMAGNIPLVGFHDFLCVLMSGQSVQIKLSSEDSVLLPLLVEVLIFFEPALKERIRFTSGKIDQVDGIIATGSNNSARYFDYYFSKYPHLIRKNRNGVAVINGSENTQELKDLGQDIFQYFGLGCRNVSKLFIPKEYELDTFFEAILPYGEALLAHHKYTNNYDYHRAIYLLNKDEITENGFLIMKEDIAMGSPVAVLFYERYENIDALMNRLHMDKEHIQCIVGDQSEISGAIPFGSTQSPALWDYADDADTMKFLLNLS